jgi:hypothetical protein
MSNAGRPPRLVLHMGPHKTATTYLQHNFHHNRAQLLRHGWLYPVTGERVRTAHHDISDLRQTIVNQDSRLTNELRAIGEEARKRGLNILLSSEGFSLWKPRHLQRLVDLLKTDGMQVVYAIRDPLSHFYAIWAQKVKNGSDESLPARHMRHFADPSRSHLLNPLVELNPVLRQPGTTATILHYDEIVARKLDIFSVFLERALGITGVKPAELSARNQRFPIELTEFVRALTPLAGLEAGRTQFKIGAAFDYFLTKAQKQAIIETVQTKAPEARLMLEVNRAASGLIPVEREVIRVAGHLLYPQPPTPDRLFTAEQASWVHYDAEALRQNPATRQLMDRALRRVGAKSPLIWAANAAFGAAIGFRRLRKRLGG